MTAFSQLCPIVERRYVKFQSVHSREQTRADSVGGRVTKMILNSVTTSEKMAHFEEEKLPR